MPPIGWKGLLVSPAMMRRRPSSAGPATGAPAPPLPVHGERMALGETIAGERFADEDRNVRFHMSPSPFMRPLTLPSPPPAGGGGNRACAAPRPRGGGGGG